MVKKAEAPADLERRQLNKMWILLRLYLLWGLVRANHAHINELTSGSSSFDKNELSARQKKLRENKRIYELCLKAIKEKSEAAGLLQSAMNAVKNREFLSQMCWNETSIAPWLWELFPSHLSYIFSIFMRNVWSNRKIGFEIAFCQDTSAEKEFHFIIKENSKNIVSVCLEDDKSKQFISLHRGYEADEFFVWLTKYYDVRKVPTDKQIQSFDENIFRWRGKK